MNQRHSHPPVHPSTCLLHINCKRRSIERCSMALIAGATPTKHKFGEHNKWKMDRTMLTTHLLTHSCTPILSRLIEASNKSEWRELKESRRWAGGGEDERRLVNGGQGSDHSKLPLLRPERSLSLSLSRSGTASVLTTPPHAEFPNRRSSLLIWRSDHGGETKAAIMVDRWSMWWTCVFVRDFFCLQEGGRRREVCPNSKGSSVALWSQNFPSPA
jgi:hypothetical protein